MLNPGVIDFRIFYAVTEGKQQIQTKTDYFWN